MCETAGGLTGPLNCGQAGGEAGLLTAPAMNTPHTEANNIDATTATAPRTQTILIANPQYLSLHLDPYV